MSLSLVKSRARKRRHRRSTKVRQCHRLAEYMEKYPKGDLEHLIEQKVLEVLGDPDSGLELTDEVRKKLDDRLKNPSPKTPHEEMLRRFA